jgi:hypothetical protein
MLPPIEHRIASELSAQPRQVVAAIQLLDEGATVPFIARYRKEVTGGLDDTQLRTLEERLGYLSSPTPSVPKSLRPRPSSASKTSTFPISRSAAPRPRSHAKRASSRSRCPCSKIPS